MMHLKERTLFLLSRLAGATGDKLYCCCCSMVFGCHSCCCWCHLVVASFAAAAAAGGAIWSWLSLLLLLLLARASLPDHIYRVHSLHINRRFFKAACILSSQLSQSEAVI